MSPISYEKGVTQMKLAPHLKPILWHSVSPSTSLLHVPKELRDLVADLLLGSPGESKGPEAG